MELNYQLKFMEMEMFMLFILASVGATLIVVYSSLFEPLRNLFSIDEQTYQTINTKQITPTFKQKALMFFSQLFHCPLCFGFWMSAVMYLFIYGVCNYDVLIHFAYACAGSGMCLLSKSIIK